MLALTITVAVFAAMLAISWITSGPGFRQVADPRDIDQNRTMRDALAHGQSAGWRSTASGRD